MYGGSAAPPAPESTPEPAPVPVDPSATGDSAGEKRPKTSKVRRVDDGVLGTEWTQELWSNDESYRVECMFSASTTHECGIMQEPTHLVDLDELPRAWPREIAGAPAAVSDIHDRPAAQGVGANTAHLPCGHAFHACALALHFLVQDMRCPICRVGCKERMSIACVPAAIRVSYASKLDKVEQSELAVDPAEILDLLTQMNLQVLVHFPRRLSHATRRLAAESMHAESLIQSRLLVDEDEIGRRIREIGGTARAQARAEARAEAVVEAHAEAVVEAHAEAVVEAHAEAVVEAPVEAHVEAVVQAVVEAPVEGHVEAPVEGHVEAPVQARVDADFHSPAVTGVFRTHRSFQRIIQSILELQEPSSNVIFMLQHPLVPLEIVSAGIGIRQAQALLFGKDANPRESIPLFCNAVSGVDPIAYIRSVYDDVHGTVEISVAINIALIVNMALYVTEVISQLQDIIS
jgi:hypothetical protein